MLPSCLCGEGDVEMGGIGLICWVAEGVALRTGCPSYIDKDRVPGRRRLSGTDDGLLGPELGLRGEPCRGGARFEAVRNETICL